MTDHIDPKLIAEAKEWAETVNHYDDTYDFKEVTIAGLITNLPDQIIDAGKLREVLDAITYRTTFAATPEERSEAEYVRGVLRELLPTPPLPTLADLIEEGYDPAQYQWGQAEHRDERCIIIRALGHDSKLTVSLLTATGATIWTSTDEVIPLPDLPSLVWPAESHPEPGEEIPDDDLPDHVEEALTQGIEDMKAGRVMEFDLGEENPEPQEGEAWEVKRDGLVRNIIRTIEQYENLLPHTVVLNCRGSLMPAANLWPALDFPAVVIATGDQVRAARKALEQEQA